MNRSVIEALIEDWCKSGMARGDIVLVHSSLKRVLRRFRKQSQKISPEDILQSFLEVVGDDGTIMFPLFNFDFVEGVPFDIRKTPSQMGILTEAARHHPRVVRTGHPIYSFAVIGAHADRFRKVENFSGYGQDSPFAILRDLGGKIAVLDLPDQNSMTFYHHVEEMQNVSYRYHKKFQGPYTNERGITETREFSLFVRDLAKGVQTDVNSMGELLWEQNIYKGHREGEGTGLRVLDANALYEAVSDVIRSGRAEGLLYRIEK